MCLDLTIAKAAVPRSRWRAQTRDVIDSRAKAMAPQLQRWLQRVGARELSRLTGVAIPLAKARVLVAKADPLEQELLELLMRYGLRQYTEAAGRAARAAGGEWVLEPTLMREIAEAKEIKVKLIARETRAEVRAALRQLVVAAETETPRPSSSALARRIARQWFGPALGENVGRGTAREAQVTADWRRTASDIEGGDREYLFSPERATVIARTELAQTENAGIARGFSDSGVERVEWLPYPNDGRSGKREHWRMAGKTITVAAMNGSDSSKWFKLPSGAKTPYPGWSGLPAGDLVQCRCTIVPA